MLRLIIRCRVYIRESLYQWHGQRRDRWRHIDHEETMRFYRD